MKREKKVKKVADLANELFLFQLTNSMSCCEKAVKQTTASVNKQTKNKPTAVLYCLTVTEKEGRK